MIISSSFSVNPFAYWLGHSDTKMLIQHYNRFIKSDLENYSTYFDVFSNEKCNEISRGA